MVKLLQYGFVEAFADAFADVTPGFGMLNAVYVQRKLVINHFQLITIFRPLSVKMRVISIYCEAEKGKARVLNKSAPAMGVLMV